MSSDVYILSKYFDWHDVWFFDFVQVAGFFFLLAEVERETTSLA